MKNLKEFLCNLGMLGKTVEAFEQERKDKPKVIIAPLAKDKCDEKTLEILSKYIMPVTHNELENIVNGDLDTLDINTVINMEDIAQKFIEQKAGNMIIAKKEDVEAQNEAKNKLNAMKPEMLAATAVLADVPELCEIEAVQKIGKKLERTEDRLPLDADGKIEDVEDFCDALGSVISNYQGTALHKIGYFTGVEYTMTGKLSNGSNQVRFCRRAIPDTQTSGPLFPLGRGTFPAEGTAPRGPHPASSCLHGQKDSSPVRGHHSFKTHKEYPHAI